MQKRKPINSTWFLVRWIVSLAVVCVGCPVSLSMVTNSPTTLSAMIFGAMFAGAYSWIQGAFIYGWPTGYSSQQRAFNRWVILSIVGGVIGAVVGHILMQAIYANSPYPAGVESFLWVPLYLTAICCGQWMVLRRQLHGAWLWILVNAVGGIVAIAVITSPLIMNLAEGMLDALACTGDDPIGCFVVAFVTVGSFALIPPLALTGGTLLYLFRINQPKEKRKVEDADR